MQINGRYLNVRQHSLTFFSILALLAEPDLQVFTEQAKDPDMAV
jgi:hypothetical protein